MKRLSLSMIALAMVIIAPGIGSVEAKDKTQMGLYCIAPPSSPVNTAMEKMNEYLKKKSDGTFEVRLFPSGQLGAESAGLNKLQMGAVEAGAITGVAISTIEPKANILMLPFVIQSWDDVEKLANSKIMGEIGASLETKGLKLMGIGSYGFFNILSVKKPLVAPEDFSGVKIRVFPTPILIDLYKALNASPTPISFPEIYTALQQGVIEATDGTLDSSYASKQYEVAKYLTKSEHIHGWFLYLVNKKWFESLATDKQKMLQDSFRQFSAVAREESKNFDDKIFKIYDEEGVEIITLSDDQRSELMEATKQIHQTYGKSIGADFVDRFYEEMGFQK